MRGTMLYGGNGYSYLKMAPDSFLVWILLTDSLIDELTVVLAHRKFFMPRLPISGRYNHAGVLYTPYARLVRGLPRHQGLFANGLAQV